MNPNPAQVVLRGLDRGSSDRYTSWCNEEVQHNIHYELRCVFPPPVQSMFIHFGFQETGRRETLTQACTEEWSKVLL